MVDRTGFTLRPKFSVQRFVSGKRIDSTHSLGVHRRNLIASGKRRWKISVLATFQCGFVDRSAEWLPAHPGLFKELCPLPSRIGAYPFLW